MWFAPSLKKSSTVLKFYGRQYFLSYKYVTDVVYNDKNINYIVINIITIIIYSP